MTKTLTGHQVQEILQSYRDRNPVADYADASERFFELPPPLGHGYWHEIELRPGLQLVLSDVTKRQNQIHEIQQHAQNMPLTANFYLAGKCRVCNTGLGDVKEEMAGRHYLYCLPGTAETEEYPAHQRLHQLIIRMAPEVFLQLSHSRVAEPPSDLQSVVEAPKFVRLHLSRMTPPTMQRVIRQIFQCPYRGITRQFYLESKVLELMAFQIEALLTTPQATFTPELPRQDVDRIYQARDILLRNIARPPSLLELARQVQINDRKLKQGFRQVFGTTVFGYLHRYRMEQAQQLLLAGDLSVQEVAQYVGYASRSSFVAAFKKKFKMAPSQTRTRNVLHQGNFDG
ncbi:helix-turn-helix transcriptional regulator [Romeria aff. gracilis LEGE 07310]|uniref:Helix-turn-helix transcriptional regulator n=1 Tax=Vasconcelosia minhoensis LEGE 07310 TaxID=915328 RepID=A0A8J7DB54_9CYAN|nr:helix-turn-helix domain-containing protein [Romeria gracilis]MBE9075863.1 helix-turn-helix transcriptional regulator [Romeria aff. gracilis LEGE 07310]